MVAEVLHLSGTVVVDDTTELSDIWVDHGRLQLDRPAKRPDRHIDGVVLAGLVDVHCHIGLGPLGSVEPAEARAQALTDRDSGVLLVRDAGVPRRPYSTRWMDLEPDLPRLLRCGQHLARDKRYIRHLPRNVEPAQLPASAEQEAKAGDGWVKLVGDWIDRDQLEPDLALLWPDDALTEAVKLAHAVDAKVTTHVFSYEGAAQALRCGVDCIEHGTGMDGELMAQAVAQGVAVVPTMIQRENFAAIAADGQAKFPTWAAHLRRLYDDRLVQAKALHEAGVKLLVGTDASRNIEHGQLGYEAELMVRAGIPAEAVVKAASWGARQYLGVSGLEHGASADLVVYPADPREDIAQLRAPRAVILRGVQVAGSD